MSEMIERVAKAIESARFAQMHDEALGLNNLDIARAAIEVMREPTKGTVETVYETCHKVKGATDDSNVDFLPDAWRAMIDAALKS